MTLPRAMLIDLDDTILSAYNNPGAAWAEVVGEFADQLGGIPEDAATAAIFASASSFWDDPERHRQWRQQMLPARREVVRLAFERMSAEGAPAVAESVRNEMADRFSRLREERYELLVAAPQRLGIYSVWHDHAGAGLPEGSEVVPDRIIRSLSELVGASEAPASSTPAKPLRSA